MSITEIEHICSEYLNRVSDFEYNNNVGIARSRESFIKKYVANRGRQLGIFIADAISLKDVEYDKQTPCENPRFTTNSVQYYALSQDQLINYFAYRTLIRKGIIPEQNHVNFLVLYLMEILNGIYGLSFKEKFVELNKILALYPKGAKYRSIIQEGYEILYLQNLNSLNKEDYFNKVPLNLFENTSLEINNKKSSQSLTLEEILKVVKLDKFTTFSEKDKFLLRECFDFVYENLNNDSEFEVGAYKSIEDLFKFDFKESFDVPYNKLKATYPITTNIKISDKNGNLYEIKAGIHSKKKVFYGDYKLSQITVFLTYLINAIQHQCGNIPLPRKPKNRRPVYSYFTVTSEAKEIDEQSIIDKVVGLWVEENQYAKNGLFLTLDELKRRKERGLFSLDIGNVKEVRKKSSEIQDKLIIEDEEAINSKDLRSLFVEKSGKDDNPVNYFEGLKKATNSKSSDNNLVNLLNHLAEWERQILSYLCNDEVDKASEVAEYKGSMLSLVIDRINMLSEEYIEDILILDNEIIEDYKEDLIIALK